MLAELLLVLSGHPSSFFTPYPPPPSVATTFTLHPTLSSLLHPGEVSALSTLAQLAFDYSRVKNWAESVKSQGQRAVLDAALSKNSRHQHGQMPGSLGHVGGHGGEAPGVYLAALATSILDVLGEYELLIVDVEARILNLEPNLVQDQLGYVPLSSLVATFDNWQTPLSSLFALIESLSHPHPNSTFSISSSSPNTTTLNSTSWTPGQLIQNLYDKSQTGHPHLSQIYSTLLHSLTRLFLTHLTSFMILGLAPLSSSPTSPSIAIDTGPDPLSPQHRVYALNPDLFPDSVGIRTRESILYIGRVAATLKREGRTLPKSLMESMREDIMSVKGLDEAGGLDEVIQRARAEIGEWLWKHILTGPQVVEAINAFGDYFLTRNAEYTLAVVRELGRLRLIKLVTSNPTSSSSVIREQDVNLALLRASVGTTAENDRYLERLRWKMPSGPVRPIPRRPHPQTQAMTQEETDTPSGSISQSSPIRNLFSSIVIGTPLELSTTVSWPLDLFMTPTSLTAYSDIHAYLFAIKDTHVRVLDCWTSLSASQRQRRKFTGASEGGTNEEALARRSLARSAWALVRAMLFWLDQLQSHFMTDVIDVQHQRLLEQLEVVRELGNVGGNGGLKGSHSGVGLSNSLRSARGPSPARSRRGSTPIRPCSPSSINLDNQTTISVTSPHTSTSKSRQTLPPAPSSTPNPQSHLPILNSTLPPLALAHPLNSSTRSMSHQLPTTPNGPTKFLDFLTLRRIHATHLAFLREGLLLADIEIATTVRDVLTLCTRFAGLVERWGGDVLPELLMEGDVGLVVEERQRAVGEIEENLRDLLSEFFKSLLDSQTPTTDPGTLGGPQTDSTTADKLESASHLGGTGSTSFSRSRALAKSRMVSFTSRPASLSFSRHVSGISRIGFTSSDKRIEVEGARTRDERTSEAEAVMSRHVEQLLLRLDFNGVLTEWMESTKNGIQVGVQSQVGLGRNHMETGLLAQGGLV